MKILLFNSLYYPYIIGGAEKSVQLLSEALQKKGIQSIVVTSSDNEKIGIINKVTVNYIKTQNLYNIRDAKKQSKFKKVIWHLIDSYNIFVYSKIRKLILLEKPDVIHTNNLSGFSPIVWTIAKKLNIPIVHTLRDYYLLCPRSTMFKMDKNCTSQCNICRLLSSNKKVLSRKIDAVVGVGEFILNKHLDNGYFINSNIKTFIYNAVNKQNGFKNLKVNNGIITYGFVGLLTPSKGIDYLLDKFINIHSAIQLLIFGKGETQHYENYLKNKYKSSKIIFKGFNEIEKIYSSIDVLIIPSLWHEPFPRTLIESYSYGVPVIASNRGGTSEMIVEGESGYVYDPDKNYDLENKILKFIKNPDNIGIFSKYCFELSNNFNSESVINQYLSVYNSIKDRNNLND